MKLVVVIDDHVGVPAITASTTVNFGRVPPRPLVYGVHDFVVSTVDVHDMNMAV